MKNNRYFWHSIINAAATAYSLALLIILSTWGFFLRSLTKLIFQAGLLAIPLSIIFYFSIFQKKDNFTNSDQWTITIGIATAILFATQIIPPQMTLTRSVFIYAIVILSFLVLYLLVIIPQLNSRTKSWGNFAIWIMLISALGGIALMFINSTYARMYADDFCYAVNFDQLGFPGAGLFFYRDWSARFFSNFLVMGFADQPRTIIYLIAFTILSLFFSLFVSLQHLSAKKRWLHSAAFALFLMLTIAISAPDFYKSFFWTGSALVLFPIFIIAPILLAFVFKLIHAEKETPRWYLLLGVILSFCIATTHEVATLGWLLLNCGGLFWSITQKTKNKPLNRFLIASAIGTLIGLTVMLLSPGITNRAQIQHYPGATPIAQTVRISIRNFFEFLQNIARPYYRFEGNRRPGWLLIIALCGLGWIMDFPLSRNWRSSLILLLLTIMIVFASFVPGAYVYRGNIPLRSQMIPVFYLTLGAFLFGTLLPRPKKHVISTAIILFVATSAVLGMKVIIPRLLSIMEPLNNYALNWDNRDRQYTGSADTPPQIDVPWDAYEQNINCIETYYLETYTTVETIKND